jgi:hypothetical protein
LKTEECSSHPSHSHKEVAIRSFGVGLLALATLAAASLLLRRRHVVAGAGRGRSIVDTLYAAGL